MFTNKKREGINTFVSVVSLYAAKKAESLNQGLRTPLPVIPFGISEVKHDVYGKQQTAKLKLFQSLISYVLAF